MHRDADRRGQRQRALRAEQRDHQRRGQRRRSRRAGGLRQARRHRHDQPVRRRVARARGAPRRGPGEAGAGKRGVHAGAREADATSRPRRYDESVAAITPEYRAHGRGRSPSAPCRADKLVAAGFLTDNASLLRLRQQQRQLRLPEGDRSRLHLHRAHRRRQRVGLGRPQRPRASHNSTPDAPSAPRSSKAKGSADARRWSRASTP